MSDSWFDNHCHLTTLKRDPAEVIAEAKEGGVDYLITVGCDLADSAAAIEIANGFDNVWATAGIHPHEAEPFLALGSAGEEQLEALLAEPKVVAVGECGLDYHYNHSPAAEQRAVFETQIALAHKHDLALMIHTREAWRETFEVLDQAGMPPRTVFHCFTGGPSEAEQCLSRGAWLSFSGIVSFNSAKDVQEAVKLTPIDQLLVETDSPYLAPIPYRGQTNRPALVAAVGSKVAELKETSETEIATASRTNAHFVYAL